ncbi:MAG: hypothetical protein JXN61_17765, partial [Sedimentisphaerales bacterium]|nr:hypothetical protein [Sedimentisphaerales bacterium]
MSILGVNLKHLYQRRGMWLIYLLFGVVALNLVNDSLIRARAGHGDYVGCVVLPFFVGLLLSLPQVEVLSKPFSYCLPGHRRMFRRYVFWTAGATCLVCSLLFLKYPGLSGWPLALVVCSGFFAGLTFYMAGVVPSLIGLDSALIFAVVPLLVIGGERYAWDVLLERVVMENVFSVVLVGILSCIAMWFWLGRADLARRRCAAAWIGFMDVFNKEKLTWYTYARSRSAEKKFGRHPRPWVEKWFLSRMEKCDYGGAGRRYWGALYSTSALAVSRWQNIVLLLLVLTVMFGYIGRSVAFVLIIVPAIFAIGRESVVFSTMLISGGRRERFRTTLGMAVTDAVLLCIGTLIVSGLSILMARFMPTFTVEGKTFSLEAIDPRVAIVPLLFLPFGSAMQLVFHWIPFLLFSVALLLPLYVWGFLSVVWGEHVEGLINPVSV